MLLSLPYNLAEKLPGWYAVIALCAVLSIVFLVRMSRAKQKKAPPSVWKINRGFAIFFLTFLTCRVLFIFSDYERLANGQTRLYSTFVLVGFLCVLGGIAVIAFLADSYMLARPGKTLTWIAVVVFAANVVFIVLAVSTTFIDLSIPRWVLYISVGIIFIIVLFIFFSLARQSTGTLRRNAILALLGLGAALIGSLLDSDAIVQMNIIPIFLPPIIVFVGLFLFALGQREI
ncbi:MAG TPA: hypothetical protein VKK79_17250 [Candidatus Lokiarchaeia archaeon]|nr:hypothetical protein [Candidatus Lokiarchaeia archaeon]